MQQPPRPWQGGDHTALAVKKNRTGRHRWVVEPKTETLIRHLVRLMSDRAIASLLNRLGKEDRPPQWLDAVARLVVKFWTLEPLVYFVIVALLLVYR